MWLTRTCRKICICLFSNAQHKAIIKKKRMNRNMTKTFIFRDQDRDFSCRVEWFYMTTRLKKMYMLLKPGAKRRLCTERRWHMTCWNWATPTPVWYSSIWKSRSTEHIIMTCFCHNSLLLVICHVSSRFIFYKTVPQHIGHAVFQTLTFHKVV